MHPTCHNLYSSLFLCFLWSALVASQVVLLFFLIKEMRCSPVSFLGCMWLVNVCTSMLIVPQTLAVEWILVQVMVFGWCFQHCCSFHILTNCLIKEKVVTHIQELNLFSVTTLSNLWVTVSTSIVMSCYIPILKNNELPAFPL